MDFEEMKSIDKKLFYNFFIVLYVLFILWFCVLSREKTIYEIRRPGWSFQYMWNCWWMGYLYIQTVGNVLLYIPLGYLLAQRLGLDRLRNVLYISVFVCIGIELLQFAESCGTLDFDDIINNTVGAGQGYSLYKIIKMKQVGLVTVSILVLYIVLGLRVILIGKVK